MRVARYEHAGAVRAGLVDVEAGTVTPLDVAGDDPLLELIERSLGGGSAVASGAPLALAEVRLLPPIARPRKNVMCIGKNYAAHAREFAGSGFDASAGPRPETIPEAPIIFTKAPCTMTGARDDIVVPWGLTQKVDYEAELGVVIGRPGRAIARGDAMAHVWGFTAVNDVTARDLQARHKQWHLGKSIDSFCPIGPWLTSVDEVDHTDLELSCHVNGELRQQANTRDLIFDIPAIIETLSASMTLETGDIIATGTPAGVGIGFDPPRFLQTGDVVRVEIAGLGRLENRVV
ncbi:MAG: fumarylacetoacetate hydrolase family protein [Gammaproteobacteria bacterium]